MKDGFKQTVKNDSTYIPKHRWKLNETNDNVMDIVPGFPVNKQMKYDQSKMVKAIKNGMIMLISYKGLKDSWKGGRERVIYPMVLGVNRNSGNELIRGWHLEGYSVSQRKETKKVWRLFITTNIKYMMFTGNFYRLPPKSYKSNDRVMTEKTIARADFGTIRRNQEKLIKMGKIEDSEDVKLSKKSSITTKIEIKNSETKIDLKKPYDNQYIKELKKKPEDIKISIMKTVFTNQYLAILGASGEKNKTVKVYEDKNLLGSYKVVETFNGKEFNRNRMVKGMSEFDLYFFVKKL